MNRILLNPKRGNHLGWSYQHQSWSLPKKMLIIFLWMAIALFIVSSAKAQNTQLVKGTVNDPSGESIPGATVRLKGSSNIGTITDLEGRYELKIPEENENGTLVFSFVGYKKQEVVINGRSTINITLQADMQSLDEVVVVGYGSQKKKDITGAIGSVDTEDIKSMPVPTVSNAIQGRTAGVQVVVSGQPGADATFRIRGTGTINNSNPLLVIDGVPTTSGLNQINMNDVESIQVLKDASAAAIYGSRGANGVVIITTKKGANGEGSLNFDVYSGVQQVANPLEMLNAAQFAVLHNEMMENNGLETRPDFSDPSSWGEGTDWLGTLFRTAPQQSYSLSYSNGNEKSNVYASASVLDQKGVVMETGYRRYTLQLNSDVLVFDRLKFGNNLTLNHDVNKSGDYSIRNAMAALPTQSIYNEDGSYAGPVGRPSWYGDISNPIGKARLVENSTLGYNIRGSVYGDLEITENLSFKSTAGIQANFWDTRTWSPSYDWQPIPQPEAFLSRNFHKSITWLWDNTLTYRKVFGDHQITAMLGTSMQENRFDFMGGSVQGFASEVTQQLDNGTEQPTLGGNASEWGLMSYMARANYDYKGKYLLTGTLRRDGSSRFGAGNKWGVFPSGSFAWRVSNEEFFKSVAISDLKIRAGYGVTGNQEIGNYSFASALSTGQYNFNGTLVPTVVPAIMPNPNVRWEAVEQINVGIDASIWQDRLTVTLDGYIKNTNDMLVPMAVPVSTGYSDIVVPQINAGKISNKGIELSIGSTNIQREDFIWTSDFNVSYNHNEVISLNDTVPMTTGSVGFNYNLARIQAGRSINEFYGFVTNGLFQTQEEVENYAVQVGGSDPFNRTSAGDIKFKDLNNDGVINDEDRTFIGNPNPDFIFALNNNLTFKNFDLSLFLQGVAGNQIFNANRIWAEGMAVAQNQTTETLNRWTGEGTSNEMPRAVFNDPNKNTRPSDRYIEDGSYLRVKNVTLGYNFPESILNRFSLSKLRVYGSAQNLYTFTQYQGMDPEVPINGIDLNVYPVTRTLTLGVNLSF
ncbi:TonB-dependent receptor [Echinicola jeungdonensis]|uniref:SusC/RagA family TonB-linked outer membrane protein n=1 Tax=Echinicola jeungdonensis TaxID=709343 RepID=A0ABV5J4S4_9BACT|nr:TonB-dependent receptor [Echinicola jeungdonensis]MDN3670665.1 TonB-dependent receptor [Echinicola jeungdonensis]